MKNCETCFYSRASMNEDLVVCTYMDDLVKNPEKDLTDENDLKTIKYFTDLSNFSGDAYRSFAEENGEPVLKICVEKTAHCGKWNPRNH